MMVCKMQNMLAISKLLLISSCLYTAPSIYLIHSFPSSLYNYPSAVLLAFFWKKVAKSLHFTTFPLQLCKDN